MPQYANAHERSQLITGFRSLAEYLEARPDVPAPAFGTCIHVFPPDGSDEEKRAQVDAIAARLGVVAYRNAGGHYLAARSFGPVEYRAVAIPRRDDNKSE